MAAPVRSLGPWFFPQEVPCRGILPSSMKQPWRAFSFLPFSGVSRIEDIGRERWCASFWLVMDFFVFWSSFPASPTRRSVSSGASCPWVRCSVLPWSWLQLSLCVSSRKPRQGSVPLKDLGRLIQTVSTIPPPPPGPNLMHAGIPNGVIVFNELEIRSDFEYGKKNLTILKERRFARGRLRCHPCTEKRAQV